MFVRHNLCSTHSNLGTGNFCIGRFFHELQPVHQYNVRVVLLKLIFSFVCMLAHAHTANQKRFLLKKDLPVKSIVLKNE